MPRTLEGLLVADLTQNLAGPYCTQLLGDFGADVIKIERPDGGDDGRRFAPLWRGESAVHLSCNRNKKSICADLDDPRGQEIVRRLARRADISGAFDETRQRRSPRTRLRRSRGRTIRA